MRAQLRSLSLVAVAALLPSAALAQAKFEGTITMSFASSPGREMTYLIKGDQVRIDVGGRGGGGYMIRDVAKNTTTMVMPEQRMYMDLGTMPGMQGMEPQASRSGKAADIKATGRKETIAGYECEHILITGDDGVQYDVCAAKGLGSFLGGNPMGGRGGRGMMPGGPPPGLERLGRDFFPLKVQRVGGELNLEVTKIEKKALDASLFQVPDGFQKMSMPGRP